MVLQSCSISRCVLKNSFVHGTTVNSVVWDRNKMLCRRIATCGSRSLCERDALGTGVRSVHEPVLEMFGRVSFSELAQLAQSSRPSVRHQLCCSPFKGHGDSAIEVSYLRVHFHPLFWVVEPIRIFMVVDFLSRSCPSLVKSHARIWCCPHTLGRSAGLDRVIVMIRDLRRSEEFVCEFFAHGSDRRFLSPQFLRFDSHVVFFPRGWRLANSLFQLLSSLRVRCVELPAFDWLRPRLRSGDRSFVVAFVVVHELMSNCFFDVKPKSVYVCECVAKICSQRLAIDNN